MATNYDKSKTYRTDTEILLNEIVKNTDDLEVNLGDVDVNLEALETLVTAGNVDLAAMEVLLTNIKTAVEIIDNAISGNEMQVDIVSGTVTANLSATDNAVLDTIDERLDRSTAPSSTVMLNGTKAFTGPFYALTALEDTVIDASEGTTNITESDDSGSMQALSGTLTIPKGVTIYGNFAVVELDSGKMIGYAAAGVTVSVAGS